MFNIFSNKEKISHNKISERLLKIKVDEESKEDVVEEVVDKPKDILDEIINDEEIVMGNKPKTKTVKSDVSKKLFDDIEDSHNGLLELESSEPNNPDKMAKAKKLKSLGFERCKTVLEVYGEMEELEKIAKRNDNSTKMAEAINDFNNNYQDYIVTSQELLGVVTKHNGLLVNEIQYYLGEISDGVLTKIESFKDKYSVPKVHGVYIRGHSSGYTYIGPPRNVEYYSDDEYKNLGKTDNRVQYEVPIGIIGNKRDFNNSEDVEEISIDEPLILIPLAYDKELYYIILNN